MNASNPRTALTTSGQPPSCPPNGGTESRWLRPGTGRLRLLPLPGGIPGPGLPSGGRHPPGTGRPRFCPGSTWGSPSPGKVPPSSTLCRLWPQQRAWTSPSPWSTRGGRSRWRSSLPSTSTCCCTSASGPLCRPGCRSAATLPGAEAPVSSLSSFYTLFYPFVGETHLGSESKVGFLSCMPGEEGRPWPTPSPARGPGFSPAAPSGKGALAFPDGPAILQSFFPLIHFSPFFFDIFCISLLILQPI